MTRISSPIALVGILFLAQSAFAQLNVIFPEPAIWLKADTAHLSQMEWLDCRRNGKKAVLTGITGGASDTLLHFHPSFNITENTAQAQLSIIPGQKGVFTIFTVFQAADSSYHAGVWQVQTDSTKQMHLSTHELKTDNMLYPYDSISSVNALINMTRLTWKDGSADTTIRFMSILGTDSLPYKGIIAEFILFDKGLTPVENAWVHTYLGIKYGITLTHVNYLSSAKTTLWDLKADSNYSNEIAGIGADSLLGLHQKQGCGNAGYAELTMSLGEVQIINSLNSSEIADQHFLLWGHNGAEFIIDQDSLADPDLVQFLSYRKWKIRSAGDTIQSVPTHLVVNTTSLTDTGVVVLVVNPNDTAQFTYNDCLFLMPDSMDANGLAYYNGITWDADSSGSDLFAFLVFEQFSGRTTIQNDSELNNSSESIILFPNPSNGEFHLQIQSEEQADIELTIYNAIGKLITKEKIPYSPILTRSLEQAGAYFVEVSCGQLHQVFPVIIRK